MWKKQPAYPTVSLPFALEKVTLLREAFKSADIELSNAFECWGLKPRARGATEMVDTLVSYGLIRCIESDDEKLIRISHVAKRDYFDEDASQEQRNRAIQKFALKPAINQVIWELWGFELPRGGEVEHFLQKDMGYSTKTIEGLVRDYRATIEFARTHGLKISRGNRGSTGMGKNGDNLEYSYPTPVRGPDPGDDTHTSFEIEGDLDITLEAGITDLEYEFDETDTGFKPKDHFSGERVLPANTRSTRVSAYGVTMLQEVAKFQVSSDRKIYLMADGQVLRSDLESLLAQLTLKLEIGDIDSEADEDEDTDPA